MPELGLEESNEQLFRGVLYKRRDVFKNRWRPRWFVLQPSAGVLSYYLITLERGPPSVVIGSKRRRAAQPSPQNSVNDETAPRGIIYLRGGCRVENNDALSRPGQNLFALTVKPPRRTVSPFHLAATSAAERTRWIQKLSQVCNQDDHEYNDEEEEEAEEEQEAVFRNNMMEQSDDDDDDNDIIDDIIDEESEEDDLPLDQPEEIHPPSRTPVAVAADGAVHEEVQQQPREELVWRPVESDDVYAGVPRELREKILSVQDDNLAFCGHRPKHKWKKLSNGRHHGIKSYRRKGESKRTMIKSVALLDFHPKQVFKLLIDVNKRRRYETSIRYEERLKRYNSHTFVDYYAYQPVWPTKARDFLVIMHWHVLKRGDERAICLFGFSYPPADVMRPVASDHVRGNLHVTMNLLRLVDEDQCELTRILSYELGGSVPQSLSSSIMQQQAAMPAVLNRYLTQTIVAHDPRLNGGEISNEALVGEILEILPDQVDGVDNVRKQLRLHESSGVGDDLSLFGLTSVMDDGKEEVSSVLDHALVLLLPLVLWRLMEGYNETWRSTVFAFSALVAVRSLILEHLGSPYDEPIAVGPVTCRFSVNLKGVLTYLAEKKEEVGDSDVSVVHLAVKAAAQALTDMEEMNCTRVCLPVLGINGCFERKQVDVSVFSVSKRRSTRITTVRNAGSMSVEEIVESLEESPPHQEDDSIVSALKVFALETLGWDEQKDLGSCLIVTSPDLDSSEIDVDLLPTKGFNVVIVLGGVRLSRDMPMEMPKPKARFQPPVRPQPTLAVSLGFHNPACGVAESRRFAGRIHQLLEFPDDY